jgi:hypothetical protein
MFTSGDPVPVRYAKIMAATTHSTEGGSSQPETGGAGATAPQSAVSLMGTSSTDRCSVCSAEMAADQRYCVECGTRRGKPRFQLAAGSSRPASAVAKQPELSIAPRLTALLALIVVLLALGVGVLIGNGSSSSPIKGPVTVVLSGSGATGSGTGKTAGKSTGKTPKPPKAPTSFNFGGG